MITSCQCLRTHKRTWKRLLQSKLERNVQSVEARWLFDVAVMVSLSLVVDIQRVNILKKRQKKRPLLFQRVLNVQSVNPVKLLRKKQDVEKSFMDVISIQVVTMHFGINQLIKNVRNVIVY